MTKSLTILLTGKNGQVGYELERSLQGLGTIVALDRSQMDLANLDQVRAVIRQVKPDLIINPAAYTAVDKAETEPELAMLINGIAPGVIAEEAKKLGAAMIHYSTDYVFDGGKNSPYLESDPTCPINVYGKTKLAGELAVVASGVSHFIFRTSWVYGMRGKNFLLTMLRLAQERDELRIVSDQFGGPTWSRSIAEATSFILAQGLRSQLDQEWWDVHSGIYHLTGQNDTSWFGFAEAIVQQSALLKKPAVIPIRAVEYPLPAPRPVYSVLSNAKFERSFFTPPDWETCLKLCMT